MSQRCRPMTKSGCLLQTLQFSFSPAVVTCFTRQVEATQKQNGILKESCMDFGEAQVKQDLGPSAAGPLRAGPESGFGLSATLFEAEQVARSET